MRFLLKKRQNKTTFRDAAGFMTKLDVTASILESFLKKSFHLLEKDGIITLNGSFNVTKNGSQNQVLSCLTAPPFLSRQACGYHNEAKRVV